MADRSLRFDLIARDKSFSKTLDAAGRKGERLNRQFTRALGDTGDRAGREFGLRLNKRLGAGLSASARVARVGAGAIGAGLAVAGLAQFAKDSVQLAATFDKTMRQVAQVTRTPTKRIAELRKVALDMGATTSFSAREAGDAMLALGKGGLTFAEQKAGALQATLTLAAAGNLELGEAADYVVQGLRAFGLGADKAATVAAALAGGANASTSSVEDMGLSLSQTAAGARTAGLSIAETTGVLAAFANNGIRGADAGTSLKTMLAGLVPATDKAARTMHRLGLDFVDAHGAILPITEIAQQLQDRLGKLSEAQRIAALRTIFGSDATRAATILMREGATGLAKYIKATRDRGAAEELAKTNTQGAAGAFERLQGAIETVQIQIGDAFLPMLADAAEWLARVLPAALEKVGGWLSRMRGWWRENAYEIGLVVNALRGGFGPAAQEAGAATDTFAVSIDRIQSTLNRTLEVIARVSQGWNLLVQATYETAAAFADFIIGAGYAANAIDKISGGSGHAADAVVEFGRAVKENAIDNINQASGAIDTAQVAIDHLQANTRNATIVATDHAAAVWNEKNAIDALKNALLGEETAELDVRQAKINVSRAQERLTELAKAGRKGSLDYRQAQIDLKRAQIDLKQKTDEYKVAQRNANAATSGAMRASQQAKPPVDKLGEAARTGGKKANDARIPWAKLGERVASTYYEIHNKTASITAKFGWQGLEVFRVGKSGLKAQAKGGPTSVGRVTLVGEEGPELVRFTSPGHVYPARETKEMLDRGMARGGPVGSIPQFSMQGDRGFTNALGDWDLQVEKVLDLATSRFKKLASQFGANIPHAAGSWRMATAFLSQLGIPYSIVSTFRPGARTRASGAVSYHALNRAVDLDGGHDKMAIWSALTRTNPTELIYSGAPRYKSRRGWRPIGALDPITYADHIGHVHAAYDEGGWLMPGTTVAHNTTGRPEKVLGPSESYGVVNLTVNVHNHAPIYGDARAYARETAPMIRSELKSQLRREGKTALANQL